MVIDAPARRRFVMQRAALQLSFLPHKRAGSLFLASAFTPRWPSRQRRKSRLNFGRATEVDLDPDGVLEDLLRALPDIGAAVDVHFSFSGESLRLLGSGSVAKDACCLVGWASLAS